ncbi:MAG: polymer-forming cytoskeletal protein [Anaerofustis stercorihominis]|nr:polymer-forming cytoskeletal protein [Anaerofustis stercorihominis]
MRKSQNVNRVNYEQVESIISNDIIFVGDITAGGSMRFDGSLKGNIALTGNLIVGRNALISGTITAKNVHLLGTVDGLICCEQLRILSTGKLTGDAKIQSLIIDDGAMFIGNCVTLDDEGRTTSVAEFDDGDDDY